MKKEIVQKIKNKQQLQIQTDFGASKSKRQYTHGQYHNEGRDCLR